MGIRTEMDMVMKKNNPAHTGNRTKSYSVQRITLLSEMIK